MIFLIKIHGNIFSSNVLKRWSFEKGLRRDMIFLVSSGRMFFFWRHFFLGRKMGDDLSQEIHGNMIFSVHTYKYYKRDATPLCQKKSKMILSRKKHLKVTEILD